MELLLSTNRKIDIKDIYDSFRLKKKNFGLHVLYKNN